VPRKDRFETVCDGSTHHITQRGLNKSKMFMDEQDYLAIKCFIRRYLARFRVKVHNYCIMSNHFHMLIFTETALDLSKFMQAMLLSYGFYYRKKYKYTGYLWQGRFKNFKIEKDSYLLECARYIERNPLRAKYVSEKALSSYQWSSYNIYANGIADDIITINPLYEALGNTLKERQDRYKEYILTSRPYEELLDAVFRG
jgi:putative transposase